MSRLPLFGIAFVCCSSAFAQSTVPPRVVAAEKLPDYWVLNGASIQADAPNYGKNIEQPGCATVSFVVEKDGSTSTIKVQKVAPEGDLGKVAASAAASMKFEPSVSNAGRDRVFSWLIFPFNLPADAAARTAVMQGCAVAKLAWTDH
ncbi:MAG: energy transducer TonB [Dokdonella sp.]